MMNALSRVSLKMRRRFLLLAGGVLAFTSGLAQSQTIQYPVKAVRIVVGYQAGGPTDLVARMLATKLQALLGQPFIVENRPGAGSNIASEAVAAAAPDGYTLLMAAAPITMNAYLYKNQKYSVEKSFEPISLISSAPGVLAVSPSFPAKSLQELIAYAKANPQKVNYGTTGNGGTQHMATELMQRLANISLVHVPYKGASGVMADLIAGHVDMAIMTSTSAIAQLQTGRVRALAVTSDKRISSLPDVPTFEEAGLNGMQSDSWNGLLAPAGTPIPIINQLHAAVVEVLKSPDIREKLESQGAVIIGSTPETFRKEIAREVAHWALQFRELKIEAQ